MSLLLLKELIIIFLLDQRACLPNPWSEERALQDQHRAFRLATDPTLERHVEKVAESMEFTVSSKEEEQFLSHQSPGRPDSQPIQEFDVERLLSSDVTGCPRANRHIISRPPIAEQLLGGKQRDQGLHQPGQQDRRFASQQQGLW